MAHPYRTSSHGSGRVEIDKLSKVGENVIIEEGVLIFHPENIEIGDEVYIGHYTLLKGYHINKMVIGPGTWVGQQCFLHSAGGLYIGKKVGIGPGVQIITSSHSGEGLGKAIIDTPIKFSPVTIEDGSDIGVGAIILPGVTIGKGSQVGAGSVVARSVEPFSIVAGVPAKPIAKRK